MLFNYLYEWGNLLPDSPQEDIRNEWLFNFGAFGKYQGMWFPCTVQRQTTVGNPYEVSVNPVATAGYSLYPASPIPVSEMDVLYSVFPTGLSLEQYVWNSLRRKAVTDEMLNAALKRALNTELITSPKRLMQAIKKAVNRGSKTETYVLNDVLKDQVQVINLPQTADILEKLWNSNDWAIQEISQLLGISYNPAHGKKERMLQNELLGDRDITLMMRRKVTNRLKEEAKRVNESVTHISTMIDTIDRELPLESEGDTFGQNKRKRDNNE